MPGDEPQPEPDLTAIRAVTIHAPPDASGRGWCRSGPAVAAPTTYDWIENLAGLDMHSADEVGPEWQNLSVGDIVSLGSSGPGMDVQACPVRTSLQRVLFACMVEPGSWAMERKMLLGIKERVQHRHCPITQVRATASHCDPCGPATGGRVSQPPGPPPRRRSTRVPGAALTALSAPRAALPA